MLKKGLGIPIILSFHFIAPAFIDDSKGWFTLSQ